MSIETRRRIADEVMGRMRGRGFPVDEDGDFTQLIGRWVDGEIPMSECHRHYLARLRERRQQSLATETAIPIPVYFATDMDVRADF